MGSQAEDTAGLCAKGGAGGGERCGRGTLRWLKHRWHLRKWVLYSLIVCTRGWITRGALPPRSPAHIRDTGSRGALSSWRRIRPNVVFYEVPISPVRGRRCAIGVCTVDWMVSLSDGLLDTLQRNNNATRRFRAENHQGNRNLILILIIMYLHISTDVCCCHTYRSIIPLRPKKGRLWKQPTV